MVLQGLAEHHGRFTSIYMGCSEQVHNARIFRRSEPFNAMTNEIFALTVLMVINDVAIPPVIL